MKFLLGTILLFVIGLAVLRSLVSKKGAKEGSPIRAKQVLTEREQPMYFRLKEALPESIVLAQVSFQALLTTKEQVTRNTFDRKYADFVICSKSFNAVLIVELDDSSHKGKEDKDAKRDAMLREAGHKVIRYKRVPEVETVRRDVENALRASIPQQPNKRTEPVL